jgi:hypothetical protein
LFPDPRELHHGGEIIIGFAGDGSMSRDFYGRTPLHPDYGENMKAGEAPNAADVRRPRKRGRRGRRPCRGLLEQPPEASRVDANGANHGDSISSM